MAKRGQFKQSVKERQSRHFSEHFKRQKVKEIQSQRSSVNEICKQYEVSSTSVYKWLKQYGVNYESPVRTIVESESDTRELLALKKKNADLERLIGQKQIFIEFQNKMIDLAEEAYGVDIKKKFSSLPSDTSGNTENGSTSRSTNSSKR
jgi:transposase-like protein